MLHYIMKMKTFIMGNLFLGLRDAHHIRHPIYKKIFCSVLDFSYVFRDFNTKTLLRLC